MVTTTTKAKGTPHDGPEVGMLADTLGATVVAEHASILAGEVSPTGYELPEHLTFDEWQDVGARLHQLVNATMWWLGEWWRYGEHRYGERAAQAAPLGHKADTLRRAARVCERIAPEERDERLTFSHHVALARVSEIRQRGRIRDRAIAEGWSTRDIEDAVSQLNAGEEVDVEPRRCECCGQRVRP